MITCPRISLGVGWLIVAFAVGEAQADAIVVTKAMQATTIAEIFVEPNVVRVEMEIGAADLAAFRNLMPDEVYNRLGHPPRPIAQRLKEFFRSGFVVRASAGDPLTGKVESLAVRRRIVRDEVTGQPLPAAPDEAPPVVFAVLAYSHAGQPASISLRPPLHDDNGASAANIGFVTYHNGLPVNDFRYLAGEVTLDLDWTDPWYSRFRHPNLRRQNDAPLSVFLYVEPYEVRQEIIVRPQDLESWLDLGLGDEGVIPVDRQARLKDRVARFLAGRNPVTIDGRLAEGRLDRIHFIRRTLRTTGVVDPPEQLDTTSATLGVIFVYPVTKLPREVALSWQLFSPRIQQIPAAACDEAGRLPFSITREDPVLRWRNYLINPTVPRPVTIAPPPSQRHLSVPVISAVCACAALAWLALLIRRGAKGVTISKYAIVGLIALVVCSVASVPIARIELKRPFAEPLRLADDDAHPLVLGLLHNVYRAFDHHEENLVYDRLSESIAGDLLSQVYLETRESMEIKNQGGLRMAVKEVTLRELAAESPTTESAFPFRCRWRVAGSVGHFGHIHRRANEHLARLTLAPIDGAWKITAIEMLDQRQIDSAPTVASRK